MKNHLRIFTLAAGVLLTTKAQAAPLCFPYTATGQLQVGLEPAPATMQQQVQATLEKFLAVAKQDNPSAILAQFSRADQSQETVAKELEEMPDKFSGYAGIQSATVGDSFRWNNYVLSLATFHHQRGQARMLESFYCNHEGCAVSNRLNRSSDSVDLVSRWFRYARQGAPVACPDGKSAFEVFPEQAGDASHPLSVYWDAPYIGQAFQGLNGKTLADRYQGTLGQCLQRVQGTDFARMNEAALMELVRSLISVCATNMEEGSLIPVIKVEAQSARSYLTPLAFAQLLGRVQQAVLLYSLQDGEHEVHLVSVKAGDEERLMVTLPLTRTEGRFDWNYFGTGAGEMLTSTYFGDFIKVRHPEAFR